MRPLLAATSAFVFVSSLACASIAPPEIPVSEPRTLAADDGTCEITLAPGWARMTGLNDEASIEVNNFAEELYGIVLVDAIADLASDTTLDSFSEYTRSGLVDAARNCEQTGPTHLTVGGRPAVQWEIRCDVDLARIAYLHTAIAGEQYYFQVLTWAAASRFVRQRSELSALTESLREIPTTVPVLEVH